MSKLFIGNPSKQHHQFIYRLVDTRNFQQIERPIRFGAQVQLVGDLSTPQIDGIILQHAPYGMIPVDEIERTRGFIPLIYSIDKPIPQAKLLRAMNQNQGVLVERGKQSRQEAAVANSVALERNLEESPGSGITLNGVETEVIQQGGAMVDNEPFSERMRVTRNEEGATPTPIGKARRRA